MALKKLSDPYVIRSSAAVGTVAAGPSPTQTARTTIDTGIDSLRREVLAIWSVQMGYTSADDNAQMENCLNAMRDFIVGGTGETIAARYGVVCTLNKQPQGLVQTLDNVDVLAIDAVEHNVYAYDFATPTGNDPTYVITTEEFRFPETYDPNEPTVPLGYVTDSQMEFVTNAFIDGVTTSGTFGGVVGSVKIIAQRMQADAALFAALLTGSQ
tara:strand:- start:261 stop:896 length:636 start_codon:yes stop_codon:yes gene_type:complete